VGLKVRMKFSVEAFLTERGLLEIEKRFPFYCSVAVTSQFFVELFTMGIS